MIINIIKRSVAMIRASMKIIRHESWTLPVREDKSSLLFKSVQILNQFKLSTKIQSIQNSNYSVQFGPSIHDVDTVRNISFHLMINLILRIVSIKCP